MTACGAESLLRQAAALVARRQQAAALDLIGAALDAHLLRSQLDEAKSILRAGTRHAEADALPLSAFMTMLVLTKPWAEALNDERAALAKALRTRADKEGTTTDRLL